jgi:hypothetical protein
MKTIMRIWPMLLVAVMIAMVSCNKEKLAEMTPDEPEVHGALTLEEVVELANTRYMNVGITEGQDHDAFVVPNDGLIDEYTANEAVYMRVQKSVDNSFASCLRSVEPSREQVVMIRRALNAYGNRNERIIANHRAAFGQLNERVKTTRQGLFRRYQAGLITQEEYRTQVQNLRTRFQEALAGIRESHGAAFSRSYDLLLRQLETVLTEEQWGDFTTCVAS